MIRYLFGAAVLVGWVLLLVINPLPLVQSAQQVRAGDAAQPTDSARRLRQVAGELYFTRVPYWDSQELVLSVAFDELDAVEHTASGIVKWHTIDRISTSPQVDEQRVEAA
ncbi:MAG: hypothetical protein R6W76_05715, partial [Caldilinea sp.]